VRWVIVCVLALLVTACGTAAAPAPVRPAPGDLPSPPGVVTGKAATRKSSVVDASRACVASLRPSGPLPADIVWRTERALNDPNCRDASTPDRCAATAGRRYQQSRLGWAAQTLGDTCYESSAASRHSRRLVGRVCVRKRNSHPLLPGGP